MDAHLQYANFSEASREGNILVLSKCTRKDANKQDVDGMTPVHWAALYGKIDALRVLIGKGGSPDKPSSVGTTALHLAAGAGHVHCLVFLTNYGCNVYAINDNGATPMQEAVSNGKLDCVRHIEALVTHQVSQDKTKVEKMQISARREAERRVKEKNKLLDKIDRGVEKKVRLRERIVNAGVVDEFATEAKMTQQPAFPQLIRFNHSDGEGFEGGSRLNMVDDESNSESFKDSENTTVTESFSDASFHPGFNHDLHKSGISGQCSSNSLLDFSKPDKNIIPHPSNPSRASSIIASLKSLHSNTGFITSGSFTNVSLQGCQGPLLNANRPKGMSASYDELMAYKSMHSSTRKPPVRTQSSSNLSSLRRPASKDNGSSLRRKTITPVGEIDTSMGPLYTLLHSLQLDEFREVFRNEKIDLSASMLCNEDDLREIGLPVGPRKKFLDATCKRNHVLRSDNEMVDSAV